MLKTRVITAVIGFIIALGAITIGGFTYDALITLLALIGWREFVLLSKARRVRVPVLWGYISIIAIMISLWFGTYTLGLTALMFAFIANYLMCTFGENTYSMSSVSYSLFGLIYIVMGLGSLLLIRHDWLYYSLTMPIAGENWGVVMLWLLLFCTWASDTFAYFAGRAFGKRKIVPSISPNKTLEGFIGGFIGCIITGIIYASISNIPVYLGAYVGVICGVLAPLGDLFESKLKRLCNVKDSGTLLPGHGGVLDRFDSLLFTAPVTLLLILFFA